MGERLIRLIRLIQISPRISGRPIHAHPHRGGAGSDQSAGQIGSVTGSLRSVEPMTCTCTRRELALVGGCGGHLEAVDAEHEPRAEPGSPPSLADEKRVLGHVAAEHGPTAAEREEKTLGPVTSLPEGGNVALPRVVRGPSAPTRPGPTFSLAGGGGVPEARPSRVTPHTFPVFPFLRCTAVEREELDRAVGSPSPAGHVVASPRAVRRRGGPRAC